MKNVTKEVKKIWNWQTKAKKEAIGNRIIILFLTEGDKMTFQEFCERENRITNLVNSGMDYDKSEDFSRKISRSDIRKMKAAEKETITMKKSDFEKYVQKRLDSQHNGMLLSTSRFIAVLFCMQLHDYYGFGVKRLENISKKVDDLMDTISLDYVSWEEIRDQLAKETGFFINLSGSKC